MRIRDAAICIALTSALLTGASAAADRVTIKLATLAPDGSPWHRVLKRMGADWQERTGGRVQLRIYPGGVTGDDPDMVRKMRIGQLHASALTVGGLSEIDSAFNVFSVPLFFDSYEEYRYVRDKLAPLLEERLEAKGFVLLHWVSGGWIHFFSKEPLRKVDDLRSIKIFVWAGDDRMVQAYKANGFKPVPLAVTDVLTGLQTGMIDALPSTPLAALSMQWFRHTPYMMEHGVAPLIGATVISSKKWNALSDADRSSVLAAAAEAEEVLERDIPQKDAEAVAEMEKRGLTVTGAGDEAAPGWRAAARSLMESMRQGRIPPEIFEMALEHRDAFRRQRSSAGTE